MQRISQRVDADGVAAGVAGVEELSVGAGQQGDPSRVVVAAPTNVSWPVSS